MKYIFAFLCALGLTFSIQAQYDVTPAPAMDLFGKSEATEKNPEIFGENLNLKDYTGITERDYAQLEGEGTDFSGAILLRNIITKVIKFTQTIMIPLAIIFLIWAGVILIVLRGNEEEYPKRIRQIIWTGVGFGVMYMSFTFVDQVFFGTTGEIFADPTSGGSLAFAAQGIRQIQGVINFLSTIAVAIGVAFMVFNAFKLIIGGMSDNQTTQAKKMVLFSVLGITFIASANTIASLFLNYNIGSGENQILVTRLLFFIGYWINMFLGFIAFFAVVAVIWAGVQMITQFNDEERVAKARKTIIFAIIGLMITFSAWTLVGFLLET